MSLANLQKTIGYTFQNESLLKSALVHSSCHQKPDNVEGDNERLEFLGDRVLGLHISALLIEAFPEEPEGKLAKRLAALVRKGTLANIAKAWFLGEHLYLGGGEESTGGREKPTILSDAVEAVLAAVYLDGGFEKSAEVVRKFWLPLFEESDEVDAKTALQEWLQGKGFNRPEYELVNEEGEQHDRVFTIKATAQNETGLGKGRSKQEAQKNAANELLGKLEKKND